MTSTEELRAMIVVANTILDMGLPILGQPEFVPVADAIASLGKRLLDVHAQHVTKLGLAAEVAAVDVAVDAEEAAKFGPKP